MMRSAVSYCLLVLFASVHIVSIGKLTRQHSSFQKTGDQNQLNVLPSPVLKVAALDYDGIVSDFLFIKGMVYLGGFISQKGSGVVSLDESQWRGFYKYMDVSTDMDPFFQDPYYVANAFLTWDADMVREVNILLEKGSRHRDWDWTLPFFIGFNYFYFLQDNDKAAEYLMEASRRPEASPTLASLASKLAFKANRTENSILFLEEIIKKTEDESTKKLFETRVDAFRAILVLEKAMDVYRKKFKRAPANPEELVRRNIIADLPKDPYGGKYFIDAQGKIRTTSEDKLMPYVKKK